LFKKVLLVNEPDVGHDRSKLERSSAIWSVRWTSRLQCLVWWHKMCSELTWHV